MSGGPDYTTSDALRERRALHQMRTAAAHAAAHAKAIAAGHPSAQNLSARRDAAASRRTLADTHFAAPPTAGVEHDSAETESPTVSARDLRTPNPKGDQL